jgi:hypothetical protein
MYSAIADIERTGRRQAMISVTDDVRPKDETQIAGLVAEPANAAVRPAILSTAISELQTALDRLADGSKRRPGEEVPDARAAR